MLLVEQFLQLDLKLTVDPHHLPPKEQDRDQQKGKNKKQTPNPGRTKGQKTGNPQSERQSRNKLDPVLDQKRRHRLPIPSPTRNLRINNRHRGNIAPNRQKRNEDQNPHTGPEKNRRSIRKTPIPPDRRHQPQVNRLTDQQKARNKRDPDSDLDKTSTTNHPEPASSSNCAHPYQKTMINADSVCNHFRFNRLKEAADFSRMADQKGTDQNRYNRNPDDQPEKFIR